MHSKRAFNVPCNIRIEPSKTGMFIEGERITMSIKYVYCAGSITPRGDNGEGQ